MGGMAISMAVCADQWAQRMGRLYSKEKGRRVKMVVHFSYSIFPFNFVRLATGGICTENG